MKWVVFTKTLSLKLSSIGMWKDACLLQNSWLEAPYQKLLKT